MRAWMNSIAPTSTPRVGCAMSSTGASNENSRAMTTFCMLPPDMDPGLRAGARAADVKFLIQLRGIAVKPEMRRSGKNSDGSKGV